MAKKRFHNQGDYAGYSARYAQEREDYGMINQDPHALANMPQNIIMKTYPAMGGGLPEVLNDTMRGVDRQIKKDSGQMHKHLKPHEY